MADKYEDEILEGEVSDDDDQEEKQEKNLRSTVRSVIGQRVRLVR